MLIFSTSKFKIFSWFFVFDFSGFWHNLSEYSRKFQWMINLLFKKLCPKVMKQFCCCCSWLFLFSNFPEMRRLYGSFQVLFNYCRPTTPPPHTHILQKEKKRKTSTLECKENDQIFEISHVKNVNKRKNRLAPVKLKSKKQDKKVMDSRKGSGGKSPSNDWKKPRQNPR